MQGWLTEGGYETPRSVEVNPRIGYAGSVFSVPEEVRPVSLHRASDKAGVMVKAAYELVQRKQPAMADYKPALREKIRWFSFLLFGQRVFANSASQ